MEILAETTPVAKKDHQCDWCLMTIGKGVKYQSQTIAGDDGIYTWKSHPHCEDLAKFIHLFDDREPADSSAFHEAVEIYYVDHFIEMLKGKDIPSIVFEQLRNVEWRDKFWFMVRLMNKEKEARDGK